MLKVNLKNIEIGQTFVIRNAWKKQILNLLKKEDCFYPSNFKIIEINSNENKDMVYICESIPNESCKKVFKIKVSKIILQYVLGEEVDDCNVGLYFNDYLPLEGTKLLIMDVKDSFKIFPYQFILNINIEEKIPFLDFSFKNLIDFSIVSMRNYIKCSWKNLNGNDMYMSDVEKMYQDTFIHKGYVLMVCDKFANYLEKEGRIDDANDLRERALIHDNSKILNKEEFFALTSIINDKSCLKNANSKLSSFKQDAIELHWDNNEHHPEHYENIDDMPPRARKEMVCDCCARSIQYGTNLVEFMETRLNDRFHFSEIIKEEILHDCKILVELMKE